jgi:hypothetical protein
LMFRRYFIPERSKSITRIMDLTLHTPLVTHFPEYLFSIRTTFMSLPSQQAAPPSILFVDRTDIVHGLHRRHLAGTYLVPIFHYQSTMICFIFLQFVLIERGADLS